MPELRRRIWIQAPKRPEPEWDDLRRAGRVFGPATSARDLSPVERDTVSRAVGRLLLGLVRTAEAGRALCRHRRRRKG